jgi:hypothetical protein
MITNTSPPLSTQKNLRFSWEPALVFGNLTPFIPLSLKRREGGEERGANAPLKHPIKLGSLSKGGGISYVREAAPLFDSSYI